MASAGGGTPEKPTKKAGPVQNPLGLQG